MCYLIAKRFKKSGCVALQTEAGEEMAQFADALQEKLLNMIRSINNK